MGETVGCSLRPWGLTYQGAPVVEQGIEPPWELGTPSVTLHTPLEDSVMELG